MNPETKRTFLVAVSLCLVCSIVVSSLAVGLKDIQERQKEGFRQQNILEAAGLWRDGASAPDLFREHITPLGLDLEDYRPEQDDLKSDKFDMAKSLQNPALHTVLDSSADIAGLKKMEKYSIIYEVKDEAGKLKTLILPIRGKGLWSTLYGFIALDVADVGVGAESIKVAGLTYYKHGETPGLGGEVDNKRWKKLWLGKQVFDSDWNVLVEVSKSATPDSLYQVDALSGATLTSNGVTNMLKFWLGKNGFGPYLQNLAGQTQTQPELQTADIGFVAE